MYKVDTYLNFFRFNSFTNTTPVKVTWYCLDDEDTEDGFRCFNHDEMKLFTDYAVRNEVNFPGPKNYLSCSEEDLPYISDYDFFPTNGSRFPKNLLLRRNPVLSPAGNILDSMDIILTDQNHHDKHTYHLDFDVIGFIEQLS